MADCIKAEFMVGTISKELAKQAALRVKEQCPDDYELMFQYLGLVRALNPEEILNEMKTKLDKIQETVDISDISKVNAVLKAHGFETKGKEGVELLAAQFMAFKSLADGRKRLIDRTMRFLTMAIQDSVPTQQALIDAYKILETVDQS